MSRTDYWQHKLSVYLHDPPHKCLSIQKHEQWAKDLAETLGCSIAAKDQYQNADMIASGLTRAAAPGYSADANQNGAVDFISSPSITHPVVDCKPLKFELPAGISPDAVHKELLALLAQDVDTLPSTANAEERSRQLFYYLHFALKKRLRNENIGKLGAAWDFLPADTRMPDHSIWQHTALASAVASAMREDGTGNVSLAVFALTPVQAFIGKARKLRDHWFGSVILSYLAFIGLRHIAAAIGPDHVVYPSLQDQSLVEGWLGKEHGMADMLAERDVLLQEVLAGSKSIASFPNKFVFIAPTNQAEQICHATEAAVQAEWVRIGGIVRAFIGKGESFERLFNHQISDYWQFSFAAARLPKLSETETLGKLLHRDKWQNEVDTIRDFAALYGSTGQLTARIYAATHSLIQGALASSKLRPNRVRKPQAGEKCPLCGEHEVLHDAVNPENHAAIDYKTGVKNFWDGLRTRFNPEGSSSEVGKNERLCAVCAVKRFLPRALKQLNLKNELLYEVVTGMDSFPATTEIAAHSYLKRLEAMHQLSPENRKRLVEVLHESELDGLDDDTSQAIRTLRETGKAVGITFGDRDKYYAVLLMDGDKMGDLINGETVSAQWGSIIHPELRKRYDNPLFQPPRDVLKGFLGKKRTLNPALHAAVSESLNSFARFAVAPLVENSGGRLIYAGGDDVCAIVPLDAALETADAIRRAYTAGFVKYTQNGAEPCGTNCAVSGKMGVHFGAAPGISISAAIVIAHHKQPLREVLRDAHAVLDGVAKRKAGRNAVAIRLKKRSGGDRDFYCKWDEENPFLDGETILNSFRNVARSVGDSVLSTSLVYRLSSLENGIAPMKDSLAANSDRITKLFAYEVGHSGLTSEPRPDDAARLAGICLMPKHADTKSEWFNPEAAIIAGFLGRKERT